MPTACYICFILGGLVGSAIVISIDIIIFDYPKLVQSSNNVRRILQELRLLEKKIDRQAADIDDIKKERRNNEP
jgi:hypothetical protein